MTTLYLVQLTVANGTSWTCHEAYHDAATCPVGFSDWRGKAFIERAKVG